MHTSNGLFKIISFQLLIFVFFSCVPLLCFSGEMIQTLPDGSKLKTTILKQVRVKSFIENTDMIMLECDGSYSSVHPDGAKDKTIDIRTIERFPYDFMRIVDVKPYSKDSESNIFSGKFVLALIVNLKNLSTTSDDFPLYSEGAIWNVLETISCGYSNKSTKEIRKLPPGVYSIGPFGVPEKYSQGKPNKRIVKTAQERLKALKLYNGSIDGISGKGTTKAIVGFQKQAGLTETGKLDITTIKLLWNNSDLK